MSEKKILREMIADNNKQHTKGSANYISTKKEVAKKMKKGVVAQSKAPAGHKDWDSYYSRSPKTSKGKVAGFRGTKKEFVSSKPKRTGMSESDMKDLESGNFGAFMRRRMN